MSAARPVRAGMRSASRRGHGTRRRRAGGFQLAALEPGTHRGRHLDPLAVEDRERIGAGGGIGHRWAAADHGRVVAGHVADRLCHACAGQYVGALDLFRAHPGVLGAEQLASALVAAELAQMPLLDLLAEDLQAAVADPDSDSWAELNTLSRAEVSQATGMLVAQLEVEPAEALVRLRAHAVATGRSATDVACDILDRRLRLQAD